MANFDSGVFGFVEGEYVVRVYFPVDKHGNSEIACKHCPFLSSNERMCQLNKKPVFYPKAFVGYYCPLELKENESEETKNETD
jgi:hypothetical protein